MRPLVTGANQNTTGQEQSPKLCQSDSDCGGAKCLQKIAPSAGLVARKLSLIVKGFCEGQGKLGWHTRDVPAFTQP